MVPLGPLLCKKTNAMLFSERGFPKELIKKTIIFVNRVGLQ